MSPTSDRALVLGAPARSFRLPEPLTGRSVAPEDYPDAGVLLVAFLANRCPHVEHLAAALSELAGDFERRGLQVLGVNSRNADDDPDEAPAAVAAEALKQGYIFPYLIDQTQAVARLYGASCTPDFYLFDRERRLFYHGRFDATRFGGARSAHGGELRRAISRALSGDGPPEHQVAAQGCAILWRGATANRRAALSSP
jgi:peroxiredoxin